jgi:hypothetical protein
LRRLGLTLTRLFQCRLRLDADEGIEARIEPRDAVKQRLDEIDGREFARCDCFRRGR